MAENKKSFVLYCDLIHTVRKMPKDKVSELFLHILSYVNDENPVTEDIIIELTFEPIKQQLKRDLKRYEKIVERNRINGKSGGRPTSKPKKPNGLNDNPKNPNEPKKPDNGNDTDNGIFNNTNLKVDWDALLGQFNEITGKKAITVNQKVKTSIIKRLKEGYSKQNILDAIINCYNDAYHKETGHKYLTLEFISRPDKLEKYSTMNPVKLKEKSREGML